MIVVQYNGTNYSGWQVQEGKKTIAGCLQDAIKAVTCEDVLVVGSGRTDAGVSAFAQVANFVMEKDIDCSKLISAINAHLPKEIAVLSAEVVSDDFSARFSAKSKTYAYYFYPSVVRKPLYDNFALQTKLLNISDMNEACKYLLGEHDFKSFVARNSGKTNFVRIIYDAKIENVADDLYRLVICGNGFLYNMVRIIMGTLIMIGEGKRNPIQMKEIIDSKDRTKAGKTVAPIGLTMLKVEYKEKD